MTGIHDDLGSAADLAAWVVAYLPAPRIAAARHYDRVRSARGI